MESVARARAIIIEEDSVLLIHRIKGGKEYYVFPGGGVEPGESAQQAVRRECLEEIGLNVVPGELLFTAPIGAQTGSSSGGQVEGFYLCGRNPNSATVRDSFASESSAERSPEFEAVFVPLYRVASLNLLPEAAKLRLIDWFSAATSQP